MHCAKCGRRLMRPGVEIKGRMYGPKCAKSVHGKPVRVATIPRMLNRVVHADQPDLFEVVV